MEFTNVTSKADILIFYVNAIESKGEDGNAISGCSVHYLFWGEGGTALVGKSEPDVTKPIGMQRGKGWLDKAVREKVRVAPAIYEGEFTMTVGSDGKPTLKLVDVAYKSNIEMRPYKLKGLVIPGMIPYEDVPDVKDYNDLHPEQKAEVKPEGKK